MVFGVIHMGIDWPFCGIKSDFSYSEKKILAHFGDNHKGPPYEFWKNEKKKIFSRLFQISKWPKKSISEYEKSNLISQNGQSIPI